MRYICEIFGVPRFSSFSTQSAQNGHAAMSDLSPSCGQKRTSIDVRRSQDLRAKWDNKLTYLTVWMASFVRVPCR
jgi:hypothetical protein